MSGGLGIYSRSAYWVYRVADWLNTRARRKDKPIIAVRGSIGPMTKTRVPSLLEGAISNSANPWDKTLSHSNWNDL